MGCKGCLTIAQLAAANRCPIRFRRAGTCGTTHRTVPAAEVDGGLPLSRSQRQEHIARLLLVSCWSFIVVMVVVWVKVMPSGFVVASPKVRHEQKRPFSECMGSKVGKMGPTTCSKTKKTLKNLVLKFEKRAPSWMPSDQRHAINERSYVTPLNLTT